MKVRTTSKLGQSQRYRARVAAGNQNRTALWTIPPISIALDETLRAKFGASCSCAGTAGGSGAVLSSCTLHKYGVGPEGWLDALSVPGGFPSFEVCMYATL